VSRSWISAARRLVTAGSLPAAGTLLAVAAVVWGTQAFCAEPAELRRLFPQEADVTAESGGLSRLVLPPEVLAACRPDLSDLRLFDAQEKEVAFLVDAGAGPGPGGGAELTQRYEPRLSEAARSEVRRETGPPLRRETFEFGMPGSAPPGGNWVLVVQPRAGEFVARVDVEGLDAGGRSVPLVQDGSLFRLGGARAGEKLRLPLPRFGGPRLRVVLETEHPFWLEPQLRLESARLLERGGRIAVPLEVLSIHPGDRRTLVDLARPRGIVPDLLRIETATGTFDRRIDVWDEGPAGADAALGSGRVYRVAALVPVGDQELALRAARGDRLRVEIDDGDSPPLEHPVFSAIIRQPSLIFAGRAAILRFGGGRAQPPRYDLAGLLPQPAVTVTGKRAEAAALLYDPAVVRAARLGAPRANPVYDGAPALGFAMRPGAEVDRRVFSHQRRIAVPDSAEGLSRLRIEPGDLAILNDDLSDLRVTDEAARQWPYLLAREAAHELVLFAVEGPERRDSTSRYRLLPPVSPLRFDRILLETDAAYFDRAFSLTAAADDGVETTLLRGRLGRAAGDRRPVSLDLDAVRTRSLTLQIEDGDDAPLEFRSVSVRVPLPEVYLTAPQGSYTLLLGAPDQDPPRYELERVREVVLAVQAAPIDAGPIEANPHYSLHARLKGSGLRQTVLLWTALVAAVVVLAFLTLRLARRAPTASA